MENQKIPRKPQTKKERCAYLLNLLNKWVNEGLTTEQAIEKLTLKQYDFLIDCNVDLDNMLLTPQQMEYAKAVKKAERPKFENGYNKKYPESKQEIFNRLVDFLRSQADSVTLPEKVNYRDVDFEINGVKYHIVMSQPRTKKEKE